MTGDLTIAGYVTMITSTIRATGQWVMVNRKTHVFVARDCGVLSAAARHNVRCIKEEEICRTRCMNRVEQLKWSWTNI